MPPSQPTQHLPIGGTSDTNNKSDDFVLSTSDLEVENQLKDAENHGSKEWFLPQEMQSFTTFIDHNCKIDSQGYPLYPNGRTTFVKFPEDEVLNFGTVGFTKRISSETPKEGGWKVTRVYCLGVISCDHAECKWAASPPTGGTKQIDVYLKRQGQLLTQACPCVSLNGQLARATAVSLDSINTSKMLELDPSLADNPAADHPDDATGPSISDTAGVTNETHRCDDEAEQLQQEFELHAKSMEEIHKKIVSKKSASKAFSNLAKHTAKNRKAKDQSSTQQRPHQPISGEVKNLIEKEILENGKKQVEVAKSFNILDQQVRRIIDDARNGKTTASTNPRGSKSKLTTDVITSVLLLLEQDPSTTLKKLAEHVKAEFNIQVSPAAIQKTLKSIEVTWKTVTPIPRKWNEAAFLQQRHDYVLNRVTNVGQKLIFIDESGFNSQTHPSHGYAISGQAAAFKTNARGSMINLLGAMSEEGMIYFELLNEDGKKKTGTSAINICNFLI
ncbi:hypothetical protein PCANC_25655 [Puccinia coronata f. sp. avenae]|uniref:Tc1-like transposase DDE domain-containing protein n=1 Tax=Puccinia coronata f. sp. avenae TaxID=200324 RepID=A0A2N5SC55_9BASI|nr:hypothetical protein PCANC_25655 [Puccinia coronata f. sp. avenae]